MAEVSEAKIAEMAKSMTAKEIYALETAECKSNPFYLIDAEYLKIKTKPGELLPFILNSSQKRLLDLIKKLREEKKPVRILILKARQIGFSTLCEAILYALTSQQSNRNSLILANEKDKANNLFDMSKLYQEMLEKEERHLVKELKKNNEKKLEFKGTRSQIIIASAENEEAAKSHTFQYVHISEAAFFRNYVTVMNDLSETVPSGAGIWDTIIIQESTANGRNDFWRAWEKAKKGDSDWIPFFVPWHEHYEYRKELYDGKLYPTAGIVFNTMTEREFLEEENELRKDYSITDEQLNWRRWKIVNDKNGDIDLFRQENPANDVEAFIASGALFFDLKGLDKQRKKAIKPISVGEILSLEMGYKYREEQFGRISIFHEPMPGDQYIISADASEGIQKDKASALVLNKRLNRTEAIINGQHSPEELAQMCIGLCIYYNKGLFVGENKGYGYMLNQLVFKKYGNVYRRSVNKDGRSKEMRELGYNTNSVTRPLYLAQLNEEIKTNATDLVSEELVEECYNFIRKKNRDGEFKRVEADAGKQDGLVIARAIAGIVRMDNPFIQRSGRDRMTQRSAVMKQKAQKNAGFGKGY